MEKTNSDQVRETNHLQRENLDQVMVDGLDSVMVDDLGLSGLINRIDGIMLDSGAFTHVTPLADTSGVVLSKDVESLKLANGAPLPVEDLRKVAYELMQGNELSTLEVDMSRCGVRRPLLSVGRLCEKGYQVVLDKTGGVIVSPSGKRIAIQKRGPFYFLPVRKKDVIPGTSHKKTSVSARCNAVHLCGAVSDRSNATRTSRAVSSRSNATRTSTSRGVSGGSNPSKVSKCAPAHTHPAM